MKVAIVAYGHTDNVLCLAKALSKYIEVTVIFVTSGDKFTASLFDWDISRLPFGLTTDTEIVNVLVGERILEYVGGCVTICVVRTPTRKMLKDIRRENLRCIREAAEYISRGGYDIVHFNGSSGFQIYFQEYLGKVGKVYTMHDYLPHSGEATLRRKWINILLNRYYTRFGYEFILHYRFLSREFSSYYGVRSGRVHTIYCGPLDIYKIFADEVTTEEPHTILFFGRISPYKGLKYLFAALPTIREAVPEVKLVIAGKGELPEYSVDDGKYEIYNCHIDNAQLTRLIRRSSVVVTPYTDATHSAVIMTAFAFNKPVVASSVSGIPEVIDDNITGRLVPPRDSTALAIAIEDLLLNKDKRHRIGQNIASRFAVGEFSWDHIAERTLAVYRRALRRN